MIDINIIKVNSKYYSVKCELTFNNNEEITAKIVGLDMINPSGATSFIKLKTLFRSESIRDKLNKIKYRLYL